ncbi:hypothetical protein KEM52_000142 [Ascosphaera acerosa]|nr:hypothetical protein KEM52_000142 [Ascosphaera acerosa]
MQKLGLLGQLHQWALTILSGNGNGSGNREDDTSAAPDSNVYRCIGVLSFVYRLCALGQAHDLAPLLLPTFTAVSRLAERSTAGSDIVRTSSSARKIVIKILRSVVTLALTLQSTGSLQLSADVTSDILENAINYFMASLGDADTPVRFAASKALSLTALRLEPEMAADVIEAVVGLLDENILYETEDGQLITPGEARSGGYAAVKRNVSAVDPLQWQGLVLTLAHLLLYRSTPVALLPDVFRSLVAALKFEQRSSTGTSVGAGVRDAANFGIWALSRKYSTAELSALHITAPELASQDDTPVLQTLAVQLVCTACLDPSGNIRRGSSAALQELIGRHPDTIVQGIPLVQTVDYHSVARRAKALVDVALAAAQLDGVYWGPLLDGLMEWRGIYSPDVESRRLAARAIGQLALQAGSGGLLRTLRKLRRRLSHTSADSIEGRHGLYLAIAAVVEAHIALGVTEESESPQVMDLWQVFGHRDGPSEEALTESVLRPDLTAEAACKLISALSHAATAARVHPTADSLNQAMQTIVLSVVRTDTSATEAAAQAASDLFELLDDRTRAETIKTWVQDLTAVQKMDTSRGVAAALAAVYKHTHGIQDAKTAISEALLRCTGSQEDITNRVAAVKCIATGCLPCMDDVECLIPYLATYLNDYTTDRRGDIGSLLRSQALAAVESIIDLETSPPIESLHPLIARLAAEKLDKVRHRAWLCLQRIWQGNAAFPALQRTYEHFSDVTSAEYFSQVWRLSVVPSLRRQVLKGIATSMSLGSETVIRASRYAILESLRAVDDTARAQQASDLLADVVRELYSSMSDDRFAIPLVELTAFLLDNVNDIADESLLDDIFVAVQKSHLKSTSISRIEAAVKVYAALLRRSSTQGKAIKKLRNMLLHPYPSVRNHVADRLYLEIPAACLKDTNWSAAPKQLKPALAGMELRPVTC